MSTVSRRAIAALLVGLTVAAVAGSEPPAAIGPAVVSAPSAAAASPAKTSLILSAGTIVPMRTVSALSTRTNREGDRFQLVVDEDVKAGGYTVIPRGSRATGEITRVDPKGAFGKSGKLGVQLLYVEAGEGHIRLDGKVGQHGKSGTGATVVTAVLVGVFSFLVTGSSATLPAGTRVDGYVDRDLPIELRSQPSRP